MGLLNSPHDATHIRPLQHHREPEPSVSGAYAGAFLAFLRSLGLRGADRSMTIETLPAHRVSESQFAGSLCEARRLLGDPLIGLRFGVRAGGAGYGLMGLAAATASSLRDTLRHLHRFHSLTTTLGHLGLSTEGERALLEWHAVPDLDPAITEAVLAGWVTFARHLLDASAVQRLEVRFAHRPHAPVGSYEALLGCRVQFEADRHGLSIPVDMMDARPRLADEAFNAAIGTWLSECTAAADPSRRRPTARRVALLLGTSLPMDTADTPAAADALCLSPRTLQRRLADEATSFRQLLDATRAHHAILRLLRGRTALLQIGVEVGFSEQSSLCRAFRRWAGCSPSTLRRRVGRVYRDLRA